MPKGKPVRTNILLVISSLLIVLFTGELVLRFILSDSRRISRYGWAVPENSRRQKNREDTPGNIVKVNIEYFNHGFKRWGDIHTKKIKMFIIGDSYTQMNRVSNGQEWYAYLEDELELELFVYGAGGYGSLQEYMVLDDYIDQIKPDLILLQFCNNDFENNLYELDLTMYPYNNNGYRPYLEDGRIVYRKPVPLWALRKYSFIADRILQIYDRFRCREAKNNLEAYYKKKEQIKINASEKEKERIRGLEKKAFTATNRILAKINKRASGIPVYLFNSSAYNSSRAEKLARLNNFIYIPVIKEFSDAEASGLCLRIVNDRHWNRSGNRVIGETLVEYFKKSGMPAKSGIAAN